MAVERVQTLTEVIQSEDRPAMLGASALNFEGMKPAARGEGSPRYKEMERSLKERIIGQDEAVETVVRTLSRNVIRDKSQPIAAFLFLGPTGVGKSQLAKEVASYLHGGREDIPLLNINLSQYTLAVNVSALTGSSPNFVGYEQEPVLNPAIIEQDKSVVLFDECEKAHPDVLNFLMQILDEGEITLFKGARKVSFRNSIVVLTSNAGSGDMMELLSKGKIGFGGSAHTESANTQKKQSSDAARKALDRVFKPEFRGRLTEVVFHPLDDEQLEAALDQYTKGVNERDALKRTGRYMVLSPELRRQVVQNSQDRKKHGVRDVIKQFKGTVEVDYGNRIAEGNIPNNCFIVAVPAENSTEGPTVTADFLYRELTPEELPTATKVEEDPLSAESTTITSFPITSTERDEARSTSGLKIVAVSSLNLASAALRVATRPAQKTS